METALGARDARFDELRTEWLGETADRGVEEQYAELVEEWRAVEWRSGGATLLTAMGLQFSEVFLCRGLAWLLDPKGGHGFGRTFLEAVWGQTDLPTLGQSDVQVHAEEIRADTRADIVVSTDQGLLLIEAKVLAGEQPHQADRLAQHWTHSNAAYVFLTRTGHTPNTAQLSGDKWIVFTWRALAHLARKVALETGLRPSAGAQEFIETIGAL